MISSKSLKVLQEYAELRGQLAELELEVDDCAQRVLKVLKAEQLDTMATEYGTFSAVKRAKWEYSSPQYIEFKANQKELEKAAQATEQEEGRAEKIESTGLSYRKNEEIK